MVHHHLYMIPDSFQFIQEKRQYCLKEHLQRFPHCDMCKSGARQHSLGPDHKISPTDYWGIFAFSPAKQACGVCGFFTKNIIEAETTAGEIGHLKVLKIK